MQIILSGCHSGDNPSPGLGVALSLRQAFPDAHLVGKDHAISCSGLHHPVFDEIWICGAWQDLDLDEHRRQIEARLASGSWYLSGHDLETHWLARRPVPRMLLPGASALERVRKPDVRAFADVDGVHLPPWLALAAGEEELVAFGRAHGWRIWVKGAAYGAELVRSWRELDTARQELADTWGEDGLHLQADVRGDEVTVAFCAFQGQMLEAIYMEKRQLTDRGKTWAGEVMALPEPVLEGLAQAVASLAWTGGAELEFVRDGSGRHWLMDFNPRFPAWIHGATLAGHNLPARLLQAATGVEPRLEPATGSRQFARVVLELPVAADHALPRPAMPLQAPDADLAGKHPSGMPSLQRRLPLGPLPSSPAAAQPDPPWLPEVIAAARERGTPLPLLLPQVARARFAEVADRVSGLEGALPVRVAWSTKTNPDPRLLAEALRCGFLAEVISEGERALALSCGFAPDRVVHNGPWLGPAPARPRACHAAFADSPESLERIGACYRGMLGPRLRPPTVRSRFGVDLDDPEVCSSTLAALHALDGPLAVSLHVQSSVVGPARWEAGVRAVLAFARVLQDNVGRPLSCVDLGGGWAPESMGSLFDALLPRLLVAVRDALPGLEEVLIEPGKLLAAPCGVLLTRVGEVRRRHGQVAELVVDASIAELPMSLVRPHPVLAVGAGGVVALGPGPGRILGRLSLEQDVLRTRVALPTWLGAGDLLVFTQTGAYDASMAYPFGLGGRHG